MTNPKPIYVVVCDDMNEGFDPSLTEVFTERDKAEAYQSLVLSDDPTAPKAWGYIKPSSVRILIRYAN
jgi:hypothetical protein